MPARSSAARVLKVEAAEPAPKAKLRAVPKAAGPRLFHAHMLVTRLEEWCVEAASAGEARQLLAAGGGHRCTPGESVQIEFDRLLDD